MNSFENALQSDSPCPDGADRPSDKPARRDATDGRSLLDRILNTPSLEQVVPRLRPDLLHRVIQTCGLEDCGEIVALATPEQLARIFDLDLWRAAKAGLDEQFDADRFGVWLEVLLESGAAAAAQKLAGIDVDLVIAGLAQHALVYDRAAVTPYETTDGELITFYADAISIFDDGLTFDVSGYLLVAKRADSWEAIVEVLTSLDAGHPDYFHQVMQGCRTLSNSGYEVDGLDDLLPEGDQAMFDLAVDREQRREKQGYVSPAQARAFLQMSRELQLGSDAMPPANPLAHAYFRAIDETRAADAHSASNSSGASGLLEAGAESQPVPEDSAEAVAAVFEVLIDAGILAQPPRAMLIGSEARASRLGHIRARLEFALDQDQAAYSARNEELAYLANTLMAGCSIQARPFTAQEASDAAIAICNLGLENWPPHWLPANATPPPISFLVDHDLVSVFQVGWAVLHNDVGLYAAEQLIAVLDRLRRDDREIQAGLDALRAKMAKHWQAGAPWRARDALDVIAILDMPAWAVLLALIDECPALHAGVGASRDPRTLSVSASDFEFISENSQIASVREFMRSLPETLRC
ncbi:MAG TPA: DUF6178 family protein [Blastocatellia bacterium]|nr:DUF6178 family protein [Blastocatellia bacterium]